MFYSRTPIIIFTYIAIFVIIFLILFALTYAFISKNNKGVIKDKNSCANYYYFAITKYG